MRTEDILESGITLNHLPERVGINLAKNPEFDAFPIHTQDVDDTKMNELLNRFQQDPIRLTEKDWAEYDRMCGTTWITIGLN